MGRPDISCSFLPFFFTGRGVGTSSCSGSRASMLQTASASLKKTIVPSTSMKLIWLASSIFSEERPKRFLFARTICSIISCIFSLRERTSAVRVSSCSCWFRNIWIRRDLSTVFSCSSVYLNAIAGTPCLFTGSDYSMFSVSALIRPFGRFGILTVDNTSEKRYFQPLAGCTIHMYRSV